MSETYELTTIQCNENHPVYSSLRPTTDEEKKVLYNATAAPDYKLSDFIGKEIAITHVYAEQVEMTNQETGETQVAPRIVLIDADGHSYQCVSSGILHSLNRLFAIYGPAPWPNGLKVEVKQVQVRENRIYTLVVK